jgi:hypothetical protein
MRVPFGSSNIRARSVRQNSPSWLPRGVTLTLADAGWVTIPVKPLAITAMASEIRFIGLSLLVARAHANAPKETMRLCTDRHCRSCVRKRNQRSCEGKNKPPLYAPAGLVALNSVIRPVTGDLDAPSSLVTGRSDAAGDDGYAQALRLCHPSDGER